MANQSDVERKEKETEQYRTFEIWNVKKTTLQILIRLVLLSGANYKLSQSETLYLF